MRYQVYIIGFFIMLMLMIITNKYDSLVLISPLLIIMLLSLIYKIDEINLTIEGRIRHSKLIVGDLTDLLLKFKNDGKNTLPLEYSILFNENVKVVSGNNEGFLILKGGDLHNVTLSLKFNKRGVYDIGVIRCVISDPLGLFKQTIYKELNVRVVVLPRYLDKGYLSLKALHTGAWPGNITSKIPGHSMEFYGLRNYMPGDELKKVNWRASARMGKLITNEYEAERVTDAIIIVDINRLSDNTEYERKIVEACVSGSAALSSILLKQGNRVGAIVMGAVRDWVRPGFGKRHMMRILYTLTKAEPGLTLKIVDVISLLIPFILAKGTRIFILSSLLDDTIIEAVKGLIFKGYRVNVIAVFPRPVYKDVVEELAIEIINLKRLLLIKKLSSLCTVILWDGERDLVNILNKYLKTSRGEGRILQTIH